MHKNAEIIIKYLHMLKEIITHTRTLTHLLDRNSFVMYFVIVHYMFYKEILLFKDSNNSLKIAFLCKI